MILEYHRPQTMEEALKLLGRAEPVTVPLGGGTLLNRPGQPEVAVVDLQALGLNTLERGGSSLELGATLTLQALLEQLESLEAGLLPAAGEALARAIRHEAAYNERNTSTVAGALAAADGRSPFATALLALDAALTLLPGDETVSLGDLLPFRGERLRGRLIRRVAAPLNARLAYEYVARTPADQPIVCVAVAQWPSGRTRVAVGGFGAAPTLAFDGTEAAGVDTAVQSAVSGAEDAWGSAEYRREAAVVLAKRCLAQE